MKKKNFFILSLILIFSITSCSGYKPIFSTSNLEFDIGSFSIKGDKQLGKKIYHKINNLSKASKSNKKTIDLTIEAAKEKKPTSKDSKGKIIEYKINLVVNILVKDFLNNEEILNYSFASSSNYKVQDQFSETVKSEKKTLETLINKSYQDILIKLSEKINS